MAGAASSLILTSCASSPSPAQSHTPGSSIAVIINGQQIPMDELLPSLSEAAGGQILDELILSRLLDAAALDRRWNISESDLQLELESLVASIDLSSDPSNTPRLIESIRRRRGLGPIRFDALLRRNAILRRLATTQQDDNLASDINGLVQTAIAQLAAGPTAGQSAQIRSRARLVVQQRAMESLARSLVDGAEVVVMDRSLGWSRRGGE